MTNPWMRWTCPVAFLVIALPAHSQSLPAVLPVPLVTALMSGIGRMQVQDGPQYFVGTLPTGYPAMLVPTGATTIVGGMRTGGEIVVVLADSTRRLPAVLEELFEASGYKRPPATPGSGFSNGSGPYEFFCKDSAMLSVEQLMGPVRDMARVTYRLSHGMPCNRFAPPPPPEGRLKLPPLKPMPGAHVSSSGGGSGDSDVDSRGLVTGTALDPARLLAHYAAQLVGAGWKTGSPAIGARVAAQFFEAADDTGKPWHGTLMVSGTNTSMNLSLVMQLR